MRPVTEEKLEVVLAQINQVLSSISTRLDALEKKSTTKRSSKNDRSQSS